MSHVDDMLLDWLHGALEPAEQERVEAHLDECPACREALDRETALFAAAAVDSHPASPPSRQRLLGAATPLRRFERWADQIAAIADVAAQTARQWLSKIDDPSVWSETALGDLNLFHIDGGPAVENAIVGFVRLQPGTSFPLHTHLGKESMFIIQGELRDEHGDVHRPGTLVERDPDSEHEVSAEPGHPLIYLSVIQEGVEIFGMKFGPDSDQL